MARSSGDTALRSETSSLNLEGTTFGIWLRGNYKTGYLDGKITDDGEFIPARAMRRQNEWSNNHCCTHPVGHIFLTPAVQAIGFDYYNDHVLCLTVKVMGRMRKSLPNFRDEQSRFAPCDKYIRGAGVGGGYIPTDEISIKNEEYHWVTAAELFSGVAKSLAIHREHPLRYCQLSGYGPLRGR